MAEGLESWKRQHKSGENVRSDDVEKRNIRAMNLAYAYYYCLKDAIVLLLGSPY